MSVVPYNAHAVQTSGKFEYKRKAGKGDPGDGKYSITTEVYSSNSLEKTPAPLPKRIEVIAKWKSACLTIRLLDDGWEKRRSLREEAREKALKLGQEVRDRVVTARQLYPCLAKHLLGVSINEDLIMEICRFLARRILKCQEQQKKFLRIPEATYLEEAKGPQKAGAVRSWEESFCLFKYPQQASQMMASVLPTQAANSLDLALMLRNKSKKRAIKASLYRINSSVKKVLCLDLHFLWMAKSEDNKKINLILTRNIAEDSNHPSVKKGAVHLVFQSQQFEVPLHLERSLAGIQNRNVKYTDKALIRTREEKNKDQAKGDLQRTKAALELHKRLMQLAKEVNKEPCTLEVPETLGSIDAEGLREERSQEWGNINFNKLFIDRGLPLCMKGFPCRKVSTVECVDLLLGVVLNLEFFFHRNGLAHRDLKTKNLMVKVVTADSPLKGCIIDLDCAGKFGISFPNSEYYLWDKATRLGWCLPSSDVYALTIALMEMFFPRITYHFESPLFYERVAKYNENESNPSPYSFKAIFMERIHAYIKEAFSEKEVFRNFYFKSLKLSSLAEVHQKLEGLQTGLPAGPDLELIQKFKRELVAIEIVMHYLVDVCRQSIVLAEYLSTTTVGAQLIKIEAVLSAEKYAELNIDLKEKIFPEFKEKELQKVIVHLEELCPALTMKALQAKCREVLAALGGPTEPLEGKANK